MSCRISSGMDTNIVPFDRMCKGCSHQDIDIRAVSDPIMNRTHLAAFGATICVIIWGVTFLFSKHLMTFFTPIQLMSMRCLIAFAILWVVRPRWSFDIRTEWIFILMAVFGNVIYFSTENLALTYTYTSEVCILTSMTSMMSLVLMHMVFKDSVGRMQVFGFILSLVGVVFVAFNGAVVLNLDPVGDVLALTSAFSWALYGVLLRRFGKDFDIVILTRKMMFYGFLMGVALILVEGETFDPTHLLDPMNLTSLLFLGGLGSCMCFILWNHSVRILGIIKSNIFIYAMPVVTLIAGHLVFDEVITLMAVVGMVLVISGMLMANGRSGDTDDSG